MTRDASPTDTDVVELVVESDERAGGGGFLEIRRLWLRNRRRDGSLSDRYICDSIARPYGQDAVVVCVYARAADVEGAAAANAGSGAAAAANAASAGADGGAADGPAAATAASGARAASVTGDASADRIRVLVRDGLRPALLFGRDPARAPLPEPPVQPMLTELVAGIVETDDTGEAGLRRRAAEETYEEAGFVVDPASVELLGAGMYPSPGAMVEKFYFVAVEVDPAQQVPLAGDGSPMEDGATTRWLDLDDAIAACVRGDITDLKTELGLRRLRDHLR